MFGLFTAVAQQADRDYDVGDTGPAGGIVFHDKGRYSDGWRYLEAAPSDQSTGIEWGAHGTDVAGDDKNVSPEIELTGTGKANTDAIVAEIDDAVSAAKLCSELEINGYDDWFLPSKDELEIMYYNLRTTRIGGFAAAYYWSSTEYDAENAWAYHFYYGYADYKYKFYVNRVRAIRSF